MIRWIAGGLVAGLALGWAGAQVSEPAYETLPSCAYEDGNVDAQPCWWTDPDTGTRYYVSSEQYR